MDLFETDSDPAPGNAPALSVSELSGVVKRVIEGEFGRVRVRGEVGRVSRPSSGHLYFDLKDDRAVLAAVCWRDAASKLPHRPEEGMEVIVTGRLTTFPGQSKYQLLVETVEPAGLGALMAMLDQRRRALAAEGLFDPARKLPIPFLPEVIAVVTSPSGAVIRDILHRLRDRFPSRVLIWPVAVQGAQSAPQVAEAIRRLNEADTGIYPRPDLIIVARGGGSVEDLWGFNDEAVVRAVAAGTIPLISAVGHETDTTLIDHAADLRAPTPTAAAEMAVPVLSELGGRIAESHSRLWRSMQARLDRPSQRLAELSRQLGRPQALTDPARQRLDLGAGRLEPVLRAVMRDKRQRAEALDLPLYALRNFMVDRRTGFDRVARALTGLAEREGPRRRALLPAVPRSAVRLALGGARSRVAGSTQRLTPAMARRTQIERRHLDSLSRRLDAAHGRLGATGRDELLRYQAQYNAVLARLEAQRLRLVPDRLAALESLDRLRQSLGHAATLRRGFAIVRANGVLVTSVGAAASHSELDLEFHDGILKVAPLDEPGRPRGQIAESFGEDAASYRGQGEQGAGKPTEAAGPEPDRGKRSRKPPQQGQGSLF